MHSSANSENVVAVAAILRDVLSPGGSSESAREARLATLPGLLDMWFVNLFLFSLHVIKPNKLSMIVDSGAQEHLVPLSNIS